MFCVGVSYKRTPVEIRQKFAFSPDEQKKFLGALVADGVISAGAVVSTCNRSEVYFSGGNRAVEGVASFLSEFKEISNEDIKRHCLFYGGKSAVKHLFNVAAGLDSMVLGEDEILRQVKEAYLDASSWGFMDGELNIIFQDALGCAKSGKASTKISAAPVSIGTIAANAIESYISERKKPAGGSVMVIGLTGRIGSIVAKDLLSKGISVVGTARSHVSKSSLFGDCADMVKFIPFEQRYDYMSRVDAIVSATSSPHYTVTFEKYKEIYKEGHLIIDLAVPYDVDKSVESLENVKVRDIDYFKELSAKNADIRIEDADKVRMMQEERVDTTMKKLYVREFMSDFNSRHDGDCEKKNWFQKMVYYLRDALDADLLKEVLDRIREKEGGI